jgi:hypothetical protein
MYFVFNIEIAVAVYCKPYIIEGGLTLLKIPPYQHTSFTGLIVAV